MGAVIDAGRHFYRQTARLDHLAPAVTFLAGVRNDLTPPLAARAGTDVDEDPLEYWITLLPMYGTLTGSTTTPYMNPSEMVTYNPLMDWTGMDVFQYQCYDGQEWSNIGNVMVDVLP